MREGYTGQVRGQDVGKDPGFLESQRDQNFKREGKEYYKEQYIYYQLYEYCKYHRKETSIDSLYTCGI